MALSVNLHGHLSSVFGLAGGAKATWRGLEAAGLEVHPNDLCLNTHASIEAIINKSKPVHRSACLDIIHTNPNILQANPDLLAKIQLQAPLRIGYWAWELEEFPQGWEIAFEGFDEIWCPSSFCTRSLSQRSPIPIIAIPHLPDWLTLDTLARKRLNQQQQEATKTFQFLCLFDFWSTTERKNPAAVIKAFQNAFPSQDPGDPAVRLIMKSSSAEQFPQEAKKLKSLSNNDPRIIWLDQLLPKTKLENLFLESDALVSLHRSEGFGLCIAEAMATGLTVIATAYSGNLDFMPIDSAKLVPWNYCSINQTTGDYPRGAEWADPNTEAATEYMRELAFNRLSSQDLGWNGHRAVKKILDTNRIAKQIKQRLGTCLLAPSRRELLKTTEIVKEKINQQAGDPIDDQPVQSKDHIDPD